MPIPKKFAGAIIAIFLVIGLSGQTPAAPEAPVALIVKADGGGLTRAGNELALTLRVGDLLFPGDSIQASAGPVILLFCPDKSQQTLSQGGVALLEAANIKVTAGQMANKTQVATCYLPKMGRMAAASQMHNGASVRRALNPDADPGTFAARLAALPQNSRAALEIELGPIDKAIAANANDPLPHVSRAEVLGKYGLAADAAAEYQKVSTLWPDAVWLKARLFTLEEEAEKSAGASPQTKQPAEPGKTFALLVGISKFQSEAIRPLNFAHEDAVLMSEYLRSERGGKLTDADIVLLTNEQATTAAIRNAFESFLKARAGKNDSVILLIATHGTVVEAKGKRGAFIVTYDSDPQDLDTTALPMADVQKLIRDDLVNVGRVTAFVDVCRSGTIGTIPKNAKVNGVVERLAEAEGQMFLFTASRSNEFSFEGPQYGGGHGAFSFFVMEALNGGGDLNNDGTISINELIEYTQAKVSDGTADRQHPRENGTYEGTSNLANTKLAGIAMKKFIPTADGGDRLAMATANRSLESTATVVGRAARNTSVLREAVDFEESVAAGRILPDAPRNAFAALRQYQRRVKPPEYLLQANVLKSALEDRGQQVILRYLAGDQVPQTKEDFAAGAAYFGAAKLLTPESILLESRETFCLGRMKLFDKDYQGAALMLERAVRLDPQGAYSFNALGIAALEQASYDRAAQAFREAAKRAPLWAYPLHNLALTYTQLGDYEGAIASYKEAIRLAPNYSYLPYNLGLVYQRLNRRKEAESTFRKAMALAPADPMAYNALGFLNASAGRRSDAERFYKQALEKNNSMLEARHNLAVLLAEKKDRVAEAVSLWKQNLALSPSYLPSRLSLAKTLAASGQRPEAIAEYRSVVDSKPGYAAARLELGKLYAADGKRAEAVEQLSAAVRLQPSSGDAWELIGDLEKAAGRSEDAANAYRKALQYAPDGSARKRIGKKL